MSSKLESDVCCRLQVAPSGESYEGNRRPGRKQWQPTHGATKMSLLPCLWRDSLHVTCGLTACAPGSAPGPTLGSECGENFTFTFTLLANQTARKALLPTIAKSGNRVIIILYLPDPPKQDVGDHQ